MLSASTCSLTRNFLEGKPYAYAENIPSHPSIKTYSSCYNFLSYVGQHRATLSRGLSSATAIMKINCIIQLSMSSHFFFTCNTNLSSFSGVHHMVLHNSSPTVVHTWHVLLCASHVPLQRF